VHDAGGVADVAGRGVGDGRHAPSVPAPPDSRRAAGDRAPCGMRRCRAAEPRTRRLAACLRSVAGMSTPSPTLPSALPPALPSALPERVDGIAVFGRTSRAPWRRCVRWRAPPPPRRSWPTRTTAT
jgi:hypothetical protein